ncbi:MAG: ATP-grasp domain-containing protein [Rhodanobacter sp.]|jgi:hypothetical protein
MNGRLFGLKFWQAQLASKAFVATELVRGYATRGQPMRILFTDREAWTDVIRKKFRRTRHQASFGDIATAMLEDYDLIVPLTIEDLSFLDTVRHRIAHNPIPIPCMDSVRLCDDKQKFNQCMSNNGFADYIPRMGGPIDCPYILKKGIDEAGSHSHIVLDREQEEALWKIREDPDYFVQDFVPGRVEYATHVLFKQGRVVCSLNVEYGFDVDMPIKGRDRPSYTLLGKCPHLELFAAMLATIGFEGLCCFNYKLRDGRPLVLEINPRFGRSLCGYFFAFMRHLGNERMD